MTYFLIYLMLLIGAISFNYVMNAVNPRDDE